MKGDGKKKENKRSLKKPKVSRDVPLPRTLPADLKPYDTNNDGVLSERERLNMNLMKRREEQGSRTKEMKTKKVIKRSK